MSTQFESEINVSIYPCLWFDGKAGLATNYYQEVFPDAELLHQDTMVCTLLIRGTRLMLLNGGPRYQVNPAVSYFVYCGSDAEIDRLYAALSDGGNVMMPLGEYPWTRRYAWVSDKFGVSWQLDVDPIRSAQKIVPSLLFCPPQADKVAEALRHYTRIFQPSLILLESPYPTVETFPEGTILFGQCKLNGFILNAMSSSIKHDFAFGPGNSLVVECDTQNEIDYFWEQLGAGGRYEMCGWLVDRYGISWQIIPSILPKLMADPAKREHAVQAFLKMKKFDIKKLQEASE